MNPSCSRSFIVLSSAMRQCISLTHSPKTRQTYDTSLLHRQTYTRSPTHLALVSSIALGKCTWLLGSHHTVYRSSSTVRKGLILILLRTRVSRQRQPGSQIAHSRAVCRHRHQTPSAHKMDTVTQTDSMAASVPGDRLTCLYHNNPHLNSINIPQLRYLQQPLAITN